LLQRTGSEQGCYFNLPTNTAATEGQRCSLTKLFLNQAATEQILLLNKAEAEHNYNRLKRFRTTLPRNELLLNKAAAEQS
jgi:hypothetical protein